MSIAFVSQSSITASSGSISNVWAGLTLVGGQRCMLVIDKGNVETIASITDNGSNAWTQLGIDIVDVPFTERWSTWEGIITNAATTLTITYSAVSTGPSLRLFLKQHTGANQSIPGQIVSSRQVAPTTANDAMTSGTLIPAAQPGLLSGYGQVAFNALNAAGFGFTDRGENGAIGDHERYEDKPITSTAAVAATFTAATNNNSTTIAVYWQDAAIVPSSSRIFFFG